MVIISGVPIFRIFTVSSYFDILILRWQETLSVEATLPFSYLPPFLMRHNSWSKELSPPETNYPKVLKYLDTRNH